MPWLERVIPVGAVAVALAAGACSESTSPGAADPVAVASDVNGLSRAFTAGLGFQSLSALSPSFALSAPTARLAPPAPSVNAWGFARGGVLELMRQLGARAPAAPLALFPANVLGKTFVWDTSSGGHYRMDSTITGAPAAGVRFWLYYVAAGGSRPSLPLLPIGNVDLADQSTPQANAVGVKILYGDPRLSGGQTLANYALKGVRTTGSFTLSASGYVVDTSGQQVTFSLSNALNTVDSTLRIYDTLSAASGAQVWMQMVDSGSAHSHSLQLNDHYQRGGQTADVSGSATEAGADSTINVVFKFNGVTWATVSGPESNPAFTDASGQTLTIAQEIATVEILADFLDIFTHADVVFAPSALVFP
jgi:hypothetical protein